MKTTTTPAARKSLAKNRRGATAIEYGIFITMVAIGGALAAQKLGKTAAKASDSAASYM